MMRHLILRQLRRRSGSRIRRSVRRRGVSMWWLWLMTTKLSRYRQPRIVLWHLRLLMQRILKYRRRIQSLMALPHLLKKWSSKSRWSLLLKSRWKRNQSRWSRKPRMTMSMMTSTNNSRMSQSSKALQLHSKWMTLDTMTWTLMPFRKRDQVNSNWISTSQPDLRMKKRRRST